MDLVKNKDIRSATEEALARGKNTGTRLHLFSHKTLWWIAPSLQALCAIPFHLSILLSSLTSNFSQTTYGIDRVHPLPQSPTNYAPTALGMNLSIELLAWHVFASMFLSTMLWGFLQHG